MVMQAVTFCGDTGRTIRPDSLSARGPRPGSQPPYLFKGMFEPRLWATASRVTRRLGHVWRRSGHGKSAAASRLRACARKEAANLRLPVGSHVWPDNSRPELI